MVRAEIHNWIFTTFDRVVGYFDGDGQRVEWTAKIEKVTFHKGELYVKEFADDGSGSNASENGGSVFKLIGRGGLSREVMLKKFGFDCECSKPIKARAGYRTAGPNGKLVDRPDLWPEEIRNPPVCDDCEIRLI